MAAVIIILTDTSLPGNLSVLRRANPTSIRSEIRRVVREKLSIIISGAGIDGKKTEGWVTFKGGRHINSDKTRYYNENKYFNTLLVNFKCCILKFNEIMHSVLQSM